MRFSGQGLMSHTSTTTISRYFNERRGKALSAIWFGLSSAEFILPIIIIFFFINYIMENSLATNLIICNILSSICSL